MKSFLLKIIIYSIIFYLVTSISKNLLQIEKLLEIVLMENLSANQAHKFLSLQEKWQWIGYLIVPIYVILKTIIIASIINTGVFFFNKTDVTFKGTWDTVIKAEFIFLLIPILKLIWFYFFQTNYTLEDIQFFYPFSALNITGYKGIEPWLLYPLQTLNLFEVVYIIYLSYQIGSLTKTNADNGLKIVGYSYVPALLLWVTVIMFFTLNYS